MARSYRASNGRIIPRRGGGQFRKTTLQDFGILQSELSDGNMICANCGYGEGAEKWRPVLKTGYCPKCKSQEKRQRDLLGKSTHQLIENPTHTYKGLPVKLLELTYESNGFQYGTIEMVNTTGRKQKQTVQVRNLVPIAADLAPALCEKCGGSGRVIGKDKINYRCGPCNGTGKSR